MKKLRFAIVFSAIAAAATLSHGLILQAFDDPAYSPSFYYDTGDWLGVPSVDGFSITEGTGASTSGFGQNLSQSYDLSGYDSISLTLRLLPGNQADYVNVLLRTLGGSGTNANVYTFATSDFSDSFGTVTIALSDFAFTLGEGATLSSIDRIQIQGSGSNAAGAAVRIQLQSLGVVPVPEPASLAAVAAAAGLGCVWLRRFRRA